MYWHTALAPRYAGDVVHLLLLLLYDSLKLRWMLHAGKAYIATYPDISPTGGIFGHAKLALLMVELADQRHRLTRHRCGCKGANIRNDVACMLPVRRFFNGVQAEQQRVSPPEPQSTQEKQTHGHENEDTKR